MEIVVADIGGTNARFALAQIGETIALGEPTTLHTADHASLATAWEAFAKTIGRPLPRAASLAIACPISGPMAGSTNDDVLKLTNSPWIIRPARLAGELGVDHLVLVNDFGAVGYAVAQLGPEFLRHIAGPDIPLPTEGVLSMVGPGTGLGVAHVLRRGGHTHVIECEGGHLDFAPIDSIDDVLLARLRTRFRRVSAERVISGPGLANIYDALAAIEGKPANLHDDTTLWHAALDGTDPLAVAALQRFCLSLGSFAGDIALAHGATGLVIGGGIGARIVDLLPRSGFASRFTAKGRFEAMMAAIPIKLVTHPQPGLFGAAAAFRAKQT